MITAPVRRRVAELLLDGYSQNPEIAKLLGITERTVKMHFKRMYHALGIVDGLKKVKLAVILTQQPMLLEGLDTALPTPPEMLRIKQQYQKRRRIK